MICLVNLLPRILEQSLSFLFDSLKVKGSSENLSFQAHQTSKVTRVIFGPFSQLFKHEKAKFHSSVIKFSCHDNILPINLGHIVIKS